MDESCKYDIKASLNVKTRILEGMEEITYFNNSLDTLKSLVITLLQNVYKKGSVHAGVLS